MFMRNRPVSCLLLEPVRQLKLSSAKRCPVGQNAWSEQVERFAVQLIKACCGLTVWRPRVVDSDLYHKEVFDSGPISPIIPKGIAWHARRAIFSIFTLRAKGKVRSIGDRNWLY